MKLKYLTLGLIAATVSIGCGANHHKGSDMDKIIIASVSGRGDKYLMTVSRIDGVYLVEM